MRCGKAREWLSLALDGQLPPDRTSSLEEHLERCEACRAYRSDLDVGHRLLRATEPAVPEGFEWRLQLRLNQTLQEAARTAALPWVETGPRAGRWWGAAAGSVAVGLAAALAFALLLPEPTPQSGGTDPLAPAAAVVERGSHPSTWRSLNPPTQGGFGSLTVNAPRGGLGGDPRSAPFENFWSARSVQDLRAIAELRRENQALRMALSQASRQVAAMQASLDSTQRAPHHHPEEAANR